MRNYQLLLAAGFLAMFLADGCQTQQTRKVLESGNAQLEDKQFDQALTSANQVILSDEHLEPVALATALYLRGRVYEDRPKNDTAAAARDIQLARDDYLKALQNNPDRLLEGRLHAGIANVAFNQDDYLTALNEWKNAGGMLEKPEDQALTLFKIGRTNQRLGRWADADQAFISVQQQVPGTALAKRAAQLQGARKFYVRVATFRSANDADLAVGNLRGHGLAAARTGDVATPQLQILRIGPLDNYRQAMSMKRQAAAFYPDAIIEP